MHCHFFQQFFELVEDGILAPPKEEICALIPEKVIELQEIYLEKRNQLRKRPQIVDEQLQPIKKQAAAYLHSQLIAIRLVFQLEMVYVVKLLREQ